MTDSSAKESDETEFDDDMSIQSDDAACRAALRDSKAQRQLSELLRLNKIINQDELRSLMKKAKLEEEQQRQQQEGSGGGSEGGFEDDEGLDRECRRALRLAKQQTGERQYLCMSRVRNQDVLKEELAKVCPRKKKRMRRHFRTPCNEIVDHQLAKQDDPLWRFYIRRFGENVRSWRESLDPDLEERRMKILAQLPEPPRPDDPVYGRTAFNLRERYRLTEELSNKATKAKVWEELLAGETTYIDVTPDDLKKACELKWPNTWPCLNIDPFKELKLRRKREELRALGATHCQLKNLHVTDSEDEELQELANMKELGHARIPITSSRKRRMIMVDRACGEQPGLVFGDYSILRFRTKGKKRTHANSVLRGLEGMNIKELEENRARVGTWKFCLFQGLVALLAKTQLRYRFVWGANIDYIYRHAWLMFVHIGHLNVSRCQKFEDILVYNYVYNVTLELVDELRDVLRNARAKPDYVEPGLHQQRVVARKELTLTKDGMGEEKRHDDYDLPVHRCSETLEKWLEKIDPCYRNCIIRTSRFCLAYWRDGAFWYIFNPYRCDEFGLWDNQGGASITKFCSWTSVKRHLLVLIIRAFAKSSEYALFRRLKNPKSKCCNPDKTDTFDVELYQLVYESCHIHNMKLYQRQPFQPRQKPTESKTIDECQQEIVDWLPPGIAEDFGTCPGDADPQDVSPADPMEQRSWLQKKRINWANRDGADDLCPLKTWHNFEIVEEQRLYVLRGDCHVSDRRFAEKNRGHQVFECYVVCAGMAALHGPEYWDKRTLEAVLVAGDSLFTERSRKPSPAPSYKFQLGDMLIEATSDRPPDHGRLFCARESLALGLERLFRNWSFGILSCENVLVGLLRASGAYYLCDAQSRGPPVFERGSGVVYLLRAASLRDLMVSVVLLVGSPEPARFCLTPVEVLSVHDVGKRL